MIFENKTEGTNYLKIKCKGSNQNQFGVGAKVTISSNNEKQYGELNFNHGFLSSSEPVLHFGLGDNAIVDEVIIHWPDGKSQKLESVKANQLLIVDHSQAQVSQLETKKTAQAVVIKDRTKTSAINFIHKEVFYEDYDREILLPHRYSQNGPFVTVGDVNNDKLEDFFVGGGSRQSGVLHLQQPNGKFIKATQQPWEKHLYR